MPGVVDEGFSITGNVVNEFGFDSSEQYCRRTAIWSRSCGSISTILNSAGIDVEKVANVEVVYLSSYSGTNKSVQVVDCNSNSKYDISGDYVLCVETKNDGLRNANWVALGVVYGEVDLPDEPMPERVCSVNSDCGEGFTENHCYDGNSVTYNYFYDCELAGTANSYCSFSNESIVDECDYGCEAGVCLDAPVVDENGCLDSDGGLNYYEMGIVTSSNGYEHEDGCLNAYVYEKVCNATAPMGVQIIPYECPNGCEDGACVGEEPVPEAICVDSDGGLNEMIFGNTNVTFGEKEFIHEDSCFEAIYCEVFDVNSSGTFSRGVSSCINPVDGRQVEMGDCYICGGNHESNYGACSGNDCYIQEAYCVGVDVDGSVYYDADADEYIHCSNGCVDGACVGEYDGCEEVKIRANKFLMDGDIPQVDIEYYEGSNWNIMCNSESFGDTCSYKDVELFIGDINITEKQVFLNTSLSFVDVDFYSENGALLGSWADFDADEMDYLIMRMCEDEVEVPTYTCTDTDGGLDYYKKGNISSCVFYSSSGGCGGAIDSCEGGNVKEYYCNDENRSESVIVTCENGCVDGACVEEAIVEVCNINTLGYREDGQYCSREGFLDQKTGEEACDNDFECVSNSCLDGKCIEAGFWTRIAEWFNRVFGW